VQELAPYVHPFIGTLALLLAFFVYRDGFAQRKQRLRRIPAPQGSRARHARLGPWSMALMILSAGTGLLTAVLVRNWKLLGSFHGWMGLGTVGIFVALWLLGRKLVEKGGPSANTHGVLGLLSLFAGGLTGVLGISLLP
jgi:hypothetical protein